MNPAIPMPAFADPDAAAQAVGLARPMLDASLTQTEIGESGFLHVVIMNPLLGPRDCEFQHAILYEESLGDTALWDADYGAYARCKALLSWRTGRGSHELLTLSPHLVHANDVQVWGSVVVDGIVVAVSGANPWYDEAFSGCVAHLYRAVALGRQAAGQRIVSEARP